MAKKSLGSNGNRALSQLRKWLKKAGWPFMVAEDGERQGPTGGDSHPWHWSARLSHCGRFLPFYDRDMPVNAGRSNICLCDGIGRPCDGQASRFSISSN